MKKTFTRYFYSLISGCFFTTLFFHLPYSKSRRESGDNVNDEEIYF